MKKVSLILAALALVLGLSQCKKQEEPAASGEKQHIVLNASFGGGNSKIADNGTGGLIWSLNDVIKVSNIGGELGELHCTDAANGTFEGDITASEDQITFTFGTKPDIYTNQTGDLEDAIYLESDKIDYRADGNYGEVKMNMPHAVLKLDLSAFASNDRDGVTVTIQSDDEPLASVLNITPASKAVYVALPIEGNESKKYTFKGNDKIFEKAWTLVANSFYTAKGEGDDPTGDAIVINPTYEVLISETFEDYTVGNKIAAESALAGHDWWTTWSNAHGGAEDGVVADFDSTQCGHLTYNNDQVLLLGNEENGIYDLEFDILVPEGKNGYFNILHNFNGPSSTWAMQCYLHLTNDGSTSAPDPGHGTIHAGSNSTADVPCVYDAWMHFRLHVDTDNDVAEYYYTAPGESEILVCTWQWSLDSFGENTVGRTLSAMDFFPPENAATSEYYLDNFSFKKIK